MRVFAAFFQSMLLAGPLSVLGLIICGYILSLAERPGRDSFFAYRFRHLDDLPAWFACSLLLLFINGIYMFRLSVFEGAVNAGSHQHGHGWQAVLPVNPLRLIAVNFVTIPLIMGLFIFARANYW